MTQFKINTGEGDEHFAELFNKKSSAEYNEGYSFTELYGHCKKYFTEETGHDEGYCEILNKDAALHSLFFGRIDDNFQYATSFDDTTFYDLN